MNNVFSEQAWEEYLYWQKNDKKTLNLINDLLKDISRNGSKGMGKSEVLKSADGYCSKHINHEDRLVYKIVEDNILIKQCKGHY